METKTAKILSVQENQREYDYNGKHYHEHWVKIEGDQQVYANSSTTPTCPLKAGESISVVIEGKKIKLPSANGNGWSGKKADPKDSGIITFLSVYSSTCNFYAQRGQVDIKQVLKDTEEVFAAAVKHSTLKP